MNAPSISERRHIRVIPGEAKETTSTLVTTSRTSHFVDIRIVPLPSPNSVKPANDVDTWLSNAPQPTHMLQLGFAGTSQSTAAITEGGPAHAVWEHWIDSRSDDPPKDQGDMWARPNGDVLETGKSVDKSTGKVVEYEELWGYLGVEKVGGEMKRVSVVMRCEDLEKGIRGLVVRVGGWCQGIVKVKGEVSVERWKYAEKKEKGSGGVRVENDVEEVGRETDLGDWERVIRLGPGALPCSLAFTPAKMKEGDVVKAGDTKWTVIEKHEW